MFAHTSSPTRRRSLEDIFAAFEVDLSSLGGQSCRPQTGPQAGRCEIFCRDERDVMALHTTAKIPSNKGSAGIIMQAGNVHSAQDAAHSNRSTIC